MDLIRILRSRNGFFMFCLLIISCVSAVPTAQAAKKADILNEQDEIDIYRLVLPHKSLKTSPQFIVIDDFNSGAFLKRKGTTWQVKSPAPGALDLDIQKQDGRNPERGYSLKADFNLSKREEASFQSFLNLLDVTQAAYFVFKVRLQVKEGKSFNGRVRLSLTDWKHKAVIYDLSDQLTDNLGEWTDVILPIRVFKSLDLDSLFHLKFLVIARDKPLKGNLSVDEIAFFGFNDTGFESNRDNLVGFPKVIYKSKRRELLKEEKNEDYLLRNIAHDTWKYFQNARDKKTDLVVDHLRMGDAPLAASYTSPTNIAMDLLATVGAVDLRLMTQKDASHKVSSILNTLKKLRKYKGFFYNFYDTKKLQITRQYLSSVDNGWLAVALVVVRQAFPGSIAKKATKILDGFDFDYFLDPANYQLVIGFDVPVINYDSYHYGMLVSEARATSLYAIGKGDIEPNHWWFLYRTPPAGWEWQNQKPKGEDAEHDHIHYFQGYYEKDGKKFVPSWGGSLFEYLMPTLVLKERVYAPKSLGRNNRIATELHRDYALNEKKYPVWGISPAATTSGRRWKYGEFGVKALSVKGYPDHGVVTPHVSFLALDTLPPEAIENIRNFMEFEIYGEYGFYDSLNLKTKRVNPQYLALDQGMIFVAIVNYLTGGTIQDRFHQDPVGKNIESLLTKESFYKS